MVKDYVVNVERILCISDNCLFRDVIGCIILKMILNSNMYKLVTKLRCSYNFCVYVSRFSQLTLKSFKI